MKNLIVVFFVGFIVSCGSVNKAEAQSEIKVAEASHQSWVAGVRGGGSGINFYLELKTELPTNIQLKKVIFRGYEVPFEKQDNLHFQAMIKTPGNQQKHDDDNSPIFTSPKNNTKLKDNEALLIYLKNGKEYQQKITNVIEKPALEYPSARPKF